MTAKIIRVADDLLGSESRSGRLSNKKKRWLMPYRDIWDHKGPLLYYLQFAGMWLRSTSTFGIGLLHLIALAIAFFLLYRIIASFTSRLVCIAIAMFSVVFVTYFSAGGNMCESWALLPLAAAHYACWRWSQGLSQKWCAPLLGASFVCIFWLRPNMTVVPSVAILVMLYAAKQCDGFRTAVRQFAFAAVAAVALTVLILAPLYRWGVFHDFVEAFFGYNAAYSNALTLPARFKHTQELLVLLFAMAIAILGTAGWAFGLKQRSRRNESTGIPKLYLRTLLLSLPFEIAAATLSGRDYPHYLLPLFPTLAPLAAWFLSELENQVKVNAGKPALIMALLLGLSPFSLSAYFREYSRSLEEPGSNYLAVVHFIQHTTTAKDKIVMVGGVDAGYVGFLAKRLPASRFVHQYSLMDANNPVADEQRKQFICELESNRPAVIVSENPLLGVLCVLQVDCNARSRRIPPNDYGYDSKVLPKLLNNMIASEYRAVEDSRLGEIRVFIRKDIIVPLSGDSSKPELSDCGLS